LETLFAAYSCFSIRYKCVLVRKKRAFPATAGEAIIWSSSRLTARTFNRVPQAEEARIAA